jgi:hypothetical protein
MTASAGNKRPHHGLSGMPQRSDPALRARAEALFRQREQQKAAAPVAMAEYRAAQHAALERMHELRRLRLARDADMARKR